MYLDRFLSSDEKILKKVKKHWIWYVLTGLLLITTFRVDEPGVGFIFFVLAVWCFLSVITTEMIITNKRVICKRGIIAIKTSELKNQNVENIRIQQSILGRIFWYGNLVFTGTGSSKVVFPTIAKPAIAKKDIETLIDQNKK